MCFLDLPYKTYFDLIDICLQGTTSVNFFPQLALLSFREKIAGIMLSKFSQPPTCNSIFIDRDFFLEYHQTSLNLHFFLM